MKLVILTDKNDFSYFDVFKKYYFWILETYIIAFYIYILRSESVLVYNDFIS